MQVPHLQISSVRGQIGLQQNRPSMNIQQPNADLSIQQNHSTLKISQTASQLFIDQTEAFADAHLKGPLRSSNEFISKSKAKLAQFIAKTAQQGDQMMRIENGFGAIPRLAEVNSELYPERELNVGSMPRSTTQVKFDYRPSEIRIDVASGMPEINVRKNAPRISIPKWQTNAYIQQKNNLSIQVVGLNINRNL
ncbi:DUF6470 family protein [Anaerobacillus isosaccharinicus]|uniref:YviE n=1 Tax=Anaerobacillus isosaccharinicus TaxID=1532552 RepID=A0A1S2L9H1_9BACI|nr:DUF6470 family protein [Anaerobacillus isosaccharinicus]MBA5584608.1 hypothetical protein [Anaerobacillus isosaccharinicus]QOY37013.1 hypothetical protein AWH56_005035 [Anaerobacillus isosaccharinicus]